MSLIKLKYIYEKDFVCTNLNYITCEYYSKTAKLVTIHVLDFQSSTIREFDSRCTSKIFGYDSCEHYYKEASLHDKIHALEVPVLTLNAADDPFSPLHGMKYTHAHTQIYMRVHTRMHTTHNSHTRTHADVLFMGW